MALLDRINEIVASEKSVRSFATKLGLPQPSVNYYIKGERKISMDLIEAIACAYPEISMEWLIRGTGDMYLSPKVTEDKVLVAEEETTLSLGKAQYDAILAEMKAIREKVVNLENKVG